MDYLGKVYQLNEGEIDGFIKLLESRKMIVRKISDSDYDIEYDDGRPATELRKFKMLVKDNSGIGKLIAGLDSGKPGFLGRVYELNKEKEVEGLIKLLGNDEGIEQKGDYFRIFVSEKEADTRKLVEAYGKSLGEM